jgi:hypothetical protein
MSYEKTVAAALAETQSKFALAEALATEIEPQMGRDAETADRLDGARQAIIDAGGEERSVPTLANYRNTAQWVSGPTLGNFRWIPKVSFTAHSAAREAGMGYDKFAALPVKTVDAIRHQAGKAGISGQPAAIINRMTPAELDAAMDDPEARERMNSARNRRDDDQASKGQSRRKPETSYGPMDLLFDLRDQQRILRRAASAASNGGVVVSDEHRQSLLDVVSDTQADLGMLAAWINGGSLDDAIARIFADADR